MKRILRFTLNFLSSLTLLLSFILLYDSFMILHAEMLFLSDKIITYTSIVSDLETWLINLPWYMYIVFIMMFILIFIGITIYDNIKGRQGED